MSDCRERRRPTSVVTLDHHSPFWFAGAALVVGWPAASTGGRENDV